VLIVSTGAAEANRGVFAQHRVSWPVLLQKEAEVATVFQANGTPSGYLITAEGRVGSALAMGAAAILELVERKTENKKVDVDQGLLSPAVASHGGEGEDGSNNRFKERSLARSKIKRDGLKALTVAPQLEKFYRAHPELEVVMVSKGEPKENRAKVKEHGLTFPIVLQQQWEISRRYAMFATPVAYLIDQQGVIVSDAAVGTDAILGPLAAERGFRVGCQRSQ
jgi:peroxiredoxin